MTGLSAYAVTPQVAPSERANGPFGPYRRVGTALALAVMFVSIAEFLWNAHSPSDRDFISFWGAAWLALEGAPAAAYDLDTLHALQSSVASSDGGKMPFPYPPVFLLFVMPFALLGFPAAMALWATATFALYMATARQAFPNSGWLAAAFAPVFANAAIGQNGFLTASLFIGGLLLLGKRPFLAGLLLGCLAIKPQLGLLLPVALVAARQWRAIAGAAASFVGVIALGLAVFGLAATQAWIAQMPLYASIARDGLVGWEKLASVYAASRQMGVPPEAAFALHAALAIAAAAVVWRVWRSQAEPLAKAAVLAAGTMLISPYLFIYDGVILVLPFLWLAAAGERPAVLAPLWLLPFVSIAQIGAFGGAANLLPLVPIALMVLLWLRLEPRALEARTLQRICDNGAPSAGWAARPFRNITARCPFECQRVRRLKMFWNQRRSDKASESIWRRDGRPPAFLWSERRREQESQAGKDGSSS